MPLPQVTSSTYSDTTISYKAGGPIVAQGPSELPILTIPSSSASACPHADQLQPLAVDVDGEGDVPTSVAGEGLEPDAVASEVVVELDDVDVGGVGDELDEARRAERRRTRGSIRASSVSALSSVLSVIGGTCFFRRET